MRIRKKPWAMPELTESNICINQPSQLRNKWSEAFSVKQPLMLELGCGKGGFISQLAVKNTDVNFIAVDIKAEMLGLAKRKVEAMYEEKGIAPTNILLFLKNIEKLNEVFGDEDKFDRIYINFCNPWPRDKHNKRRLTYFNKLMYYKELLRDSGQIWFKTDDSELFEESLAYFHDAGYKVKFITRDLHNSDFKENIMTEHEKMFSDEGILIKMLIAEPIRQKIALMETQPANYSYDSILGEMSNTNRDMQNIFVLARGGCVSDEVISTLVELKSAERDFNIHILLADSYNRDVISSIQTKFSQNNLRINSFALDIDANDEAKAEFSTLNDESHRCVFFTPISLGNIGESGVKYISAHFSNYKTFHEDILNTKYNKDVWYADGILF